MPVFVVPEIFWRGVAVRNDPLDSYRLRFEQCLGDFF